MNSNNKSSDGNNLNDFVHNMEHTAPQWGGLQKPAPTKLGVGLQGWVCPKCGRVFSPFTSMCPYCGGEDRFKVTC